MTRFGQLILTWIGILGASLVIVAPAHAAESVVFRYGLLELPLPVVDLHYYAQTHQVRPVIRGLFQFISKTDQQSLYELLRARLPLNRVALDRVLHERIGLRLLAQAADALADGSIAGVQALRSAAILGTQPEGLSLLSFLEAYPKERLILDVPKTLKLVDTIGPKLPIDRLSSLPFWQVLVAYQATVIQNHAYPVCLFGDSISAQLGDSLGRSVYNFSIGGMSSVSLVEQLKQLQAHGIQCKKVILAIGTNDAWYTIADDQFVQNFKTAIAMSRSMGAEKILVLPAFYSTVAASKNPNLAGPIDRVDQINRLLAQITARESLEFDDTVLQPLYSGKELNATLTTDGVHLNTDGIERYRQILQAFVN